MRRVSIALAALAATALVPVASQAATLADSSCSLSTGCLFTKANDKEADIESAYNAVFGAGALDLVFLKKVEFNGPDQFTGTWSWDGATPVSFITVKAATQVMLYKIDPASFTGTWTTAGMTNNGGNQPGISHYTLWGGTGGDDVISAPGIPEPATWAMMIGGFALLGGSLRRRGSLAQA